MTDNDRWRQEGRWTNEADVLNRLWTLIGVPIPTGYHAVGATAVLVAADDDGTLGRYPVYLNISNDPRVERAELREAVLALNRLALGHDQTFPKALRPERDHG